jgi:hypothetical protein
VPITDGDGDAADIAGLKDRWRVAPAEFRFNYGLPPCRRARFDTLGVSNG